MPEKNPSTPSAAAGEKTDESTMLTAEGVDISKEDEFPTRGQQMPPPNTGGEERETAGEHGDMAPEAAKGLEKARKE